MSILGRTIPGSENHQALANRAIEGFGTQYPDFSASGFERLIKHVADALGLPKRLVTQTLARADQTHGYQEREGRAPE